jgi:cyclophilin family peptidyl-prolyl cis-trans isomerase
MKAFRLLVSIGLVFLVHAIALAQETRILFKLENKGEFTITLNTKAAPRTCAHIISLVERGFYNGLRFHRAEKKPKPFLVQIGDPNTRDSDVNPDSRTGSGKGIAKEESGLQNELGAVGLASIPEEGILGDSQFYILLTPAKFLDGKYTVFGKVTSGMPVVQSIEKGDRITSAKVIRGA